MFPRDGGDRSSATTDPQSPSHANRPSNSRDTQTPKDIRETRPLGPGGVAVDGVAVDGIAAARAEILALSNESLEVAKALAAKYPRSTDPIGLLGMVYNQLEESSKAQACWEEVVRRNPRRADSFESLARLYIRRGDFDRAIAMCRRGIATAGETPALDIRLGEALILAGQPERAIEALRDSFGDAGAQPASEALILLGKAYFLLERYQQSKDNYGLAIKALPDDPRALFGYASACDRLGLEREAGEAFAKHKALTDASSESSRHHRDISHDVDRYRQILSLTCFNAAQVYVGNGDWASAETVLRRGIDAHPGEVNCRALLVALLRKTRRGEAAISLCRKLIELEPANYEYPLQLSMIYAELDRPADSLVEATAALALAPDNKECQQQAAALKDKGPSHGVHR